MVTTTSQHISQQFENELQDIRSRVLAMGGLVEQQVHNAMEALIKGDADIAREVIAYDDEVNSLEVSIDEECIQIIALRQPTAGDLRLVSGILKTITDLERIGDESVRIARMALNLSEKIVPSIITVSCRPWVIMCVACYAMHWMLLRDLMWIWLYAWQKKTVKSMPNMRRFYVS